MPSQARSLTTRLEDRVCTVPSQARSLTTRLEDRVCTVPSQARPGDPVVGWEGGGGICEGESSSH